MAFLQYFINVLTTCKRTQKKKSLAQYEIGETIGKGGTSKVKEAYDREGNKYAIKILKNLRGSN